MAVIATLNTVFSANTAGLDAGAKRARSSVASFQSAVSQIGATVAAAFSVDALARFTAHAFETVDSMHDLSEATGATTEQISALHVAATLNASSTDEIDSALKKLNRTLGSAEGSNQIQDSLTKIGLSAEALKSMGVANAFAAISEAMKTVEDPAERARIATDLFGQSGSELLNVLALGADGFEQAAMQAEALGLSVSGIEAARVGEAGEAIDRMKLSLEGLATQAAITFAPLVEFFAKAIPREIKIAQADLLSWSATAVTGIKKILDAVSYLPDWLGGGMAANASSAMDAYIEELNRAEKEIREQARILDGGAPGNRQNTFAPTVEAAVVSQEAAIAGLEQLTTDVKGFFTFATEAAKTAQQEAAKQGVANLMNAGMGFADFLKNAKAKGDKLITDKAAGVIDSVMTPLEKFDKTMADLEALNNVGAFKDAPEAFARAQAKALSELDQATSQSGTSGRASIIERGTAEAFKAEREGRDSPAKTQKQILDQAKRQTALQEQQLAAFKEGGAVPVNF